MTTMTILNILISIAGVALVAGVMRFGYVLAGRPEAARLAPTERERPAELERAA